MRMCNDIGGDGKWLCAVFICGTRSHSETERKQVRCKKNRVITGFSVEYDEAEA